MILIEHSRSYFFRSLRWLFALLLMILLHPLSGRADGDAPVSVQPTEGETAGAVFCTDPYLEICARSDVMEIEGDARLKEIVKFHRMRALADLLTRTRGWSARDAVRLRVEQERRVMRKVLLQAAQLEDGRIRPEFERVRALLVQEIQNSRDLSTRSRDDYINRILTVEWVGARFFSGLLERTSSWTAEEQDIGSAFVEICGNGLEINAFLYRRGSMARWNPRSWGWDVRSRDLLVVCPGRILEHDLKDPRSALRIRGMLARLFGHELAHAIDAGVDPAGYERYQSCMAERPSSASLGTASGDSIEEAFWTSRMRVDSHASEMVADQWGLKVLGRMLESGELGATYEQKLDSLRASFARFCLRTGDDGTHPSGRYRIETLAGSEPSIRRAMGCAVSASPPESSCVW